MKNSEGLKEKIEDAKKCSDDFTKKLQSSHAQLGVAGGATTDEEAKKAILRTNAIKDKGADELEKLFKSVESLAKAAQDALANSVNELTSPVVAETPKKP